VAEITDRLNEISFNASLTAELRAIAFVNRLLDTGQLTPEAQSRYRHIFVHAIRRTLAGRPLPGVEVRHRMELPPGPARTRPPRRGPLAADLFRAGGRRLHRDDLRGLPGRRA
jgi:hypothetical protein